MKPSLRRAAVAERDDGKLGRERIQERAMADALATLIAAFDGRER